MAHCHMCLTNNMDKLSSADREIFFHAIYEAELEFIECGSCAEEILESLQDS